MKQTDFKDWSSPLIPYHGSMFWWMLLSLFLCIDILSLPNASSAQQSRLGTLTIGPNAEALGLNEAVTAEMLGASSLYTNPANLAFEYSSSLNASYTFWIGDLKHTNAAVNLRKGRRALAFGFLGSQVDDIPLRGNQPGPADGSFNVSFLSLSGGYAYRFGSVALGATFQYLREEYYIYDASGFAANLGASARFWEGRIQAGTSLLNLGQMNKLHNEATPLPTTFRTGFSAELFTFTAPQNEDLPITLSLKNDLVVPIKSTNSTTQSEGDREVYTNIALEFDIANSIALRTGYKSGNNVRHWSAGVGVEVGLFKANYAIVPFETGFGTAHSIGLQYYFQKPSTSSLDRLSGSPKASFQKE